MEMFKSSSKLEGIDHMEDKIPGTIKNMSRDLVRELKPKCPHCGGDL